MQVHDGVGGSPWTTVSNPHGSGGSYLATSSKAADRFIQVQSSLGAGYYSIYIYPPIPLRRKSLSNAVPYTIGSNIVWFNQRERSGSNFIRLEADGAEDDQTIFFLDPPKVRIDTLNSAYGQVVADAIRFCRKSNGPAQAAVDGGEVSAVVSNPVAASGFVAVGVVVTIAVVAAIQLAKKRRDQAQTNALPIAVTATEQQQPTELVEFTTSSVTNPAPTLRTMEQLYAELEPQVTVKADDIPSN